MIVSDAFMKRSFGRKLVENFLVHKDLTHAIHTTGVYLPGHGTPTIILFGRNQRPIRETIRAVRSIRGETGVPSDPANAPVWLEITNHLGEPGFEGHHVSVADVPRLSLAKHPWPFGGGGATELKQLIDKSARRRLKQLAPAVGRIAVLGEEDAWFSGLAVCHRATMKDLAKPFVAGEDVRDWRIESRDFVLYPYETFGGKAIEALPELILRRFWPSRTVLKGRSVFKRTIAQMGKHWWELLEHYRAKLKAPASIALGEIATHNHFVLDRGGKVFNRTAPVIKRNSSGGQGRGSKEGAAA